MSQTDNREITFIQVNSGDFSNTGTPQSFNNTLPFPVVLDQSKKDYEVAVFDIMFTNRQGTTPPINSVYVSSNLSDGTTIIGSQTTNTVLWIPWTEIINQSVATPTLGANSSSVYLTTEKNRKWYPLANFAQIRNIVCALTMSTGDPIPYDANKDFTSITFGIREKY